MQDALNYQWSDYVPNCILHNGLEQPYNAGHCIQSKQPIIDILLRDHAKLDNVRGELVMLSIQNSCLAKQN
jgi:hypothetical protein